MSGWAVGYRGVTTYNRHELEVVSHQGRPVLVKRFRAGTLGGSRELWARAMLDAHGCQLAPPLHWMRTDGDRIELGMDLLRPDKDVLGSASPAIVSKLGFELGRMHAQCRLSTSLGGGLVARLWALDKVRLLVATRAWAGFAGLEVERLVRDLDSACRSVPMTLIHRDLTPDNILIQRGRPWVIDWEVATIGHPDLDLARLRLALTTTSTEAMHEGYAEGWSGIAPWEDDRFTPARLALFRSLFCAEMHAHLVATGQEDGAYAQEILHLAQAGR